MAGHVFLIGFMGSGKTHWGRVVARALSRPFLDLDEWIETEQGQTISQIFSDAGESDFRVLERQYLQRLGEFTPSVVATGGGTPCFFDNLEWMRQKGIVVYLKASPDILFQRLKSEREKRPLLAAYEETELPALIHDRLGDRAPVYERADHIVEQSGDDAAFLQQLLDAIRATS